MQYYCFECGVPVHDACGRIPALSLVFYCIECTKLIDLAALDFASRNGVYYSSPRESPSGRRTPATPQTTEIKKSKPRECPCGIFRNDCDYHRD